MMGANWQPDCITNVIEKFAILPVKTTSGKRIWLRKYILVEKYIDSYLSHPIKSNYWTLIYTKNEWLAKQLKGA